MSEKRLCPHCGQPLEAWVGPPESGWGELLVCNNNTCVYYTGSLSDIRYKDEDNHLGCRYAENPDNGYTPFALLAWLPEV